MKKTIFIILIAVVSLLTSCKKKETVTIDVNKDVKDYFLFAGNGSSWFYFDRIKRVNDTVKLSNYITQTNAVCSDEETVLASYSYTLNGALNTVSAVDCSKEGACSISFAIPDFKLSFKTTCDEKGKYAMPMEKLEDTVFNNIHYPVIYHFTETTKDTNTINYYFASKVGLIWAYDTKNKLSVVMYSKDIK